jgi:hypothetical protein
MPSLLSKLRPCDRPNDMRHGARVYLDAMSAERRAAAVAKGALPTTWSVE